MPRTESEPMVRAHVQLYASDWEWLKDVFGRDIKPSNAIRKLVRHYRKQTEARALARAQATEVSDADVAAIAAALAARDDLED